MSDVLIANKGREGHRLDLDVTTYTHGESVESIR